MSDAMKRFDSWADLEILTEKAETACKKGNVQTLKAATLAAVESLRSSYRSGMIDDETRQKRFDMLGLRILVALIME